jgi:glycine betaine transporter
MFSDNGNENPSNRHKLVWGFIITATALGLPLGPVSYLGISNLLVIMALLLVFYMAILFYFFKK